MKIPEFTPIQMIRTDEQHFGSGKVIPLSKVLSDNTPVTSVKGISSGTEAASITKTSDGTSKVTFQDYLLEAMNTMNNQQVAVTDLQEKLITNPDEVDVHDVTIAMSKAQMSLNLAQTVIDRLVTSWNELSTTR
ncbi:MAG: flagellar hook-basal body complex protein FliE [Treponema sp.]|nr:flagellar hook-basal body complex protein FliE [Treponema sp.]